MNTGFTWSRGGMFGSVAIARVASLVIALMLSVAAPCLPQTFATVPGHATFSMFPWERIDLSSLQGQLVFTDFSLPGNVGFEFKVSRIYDINQRTWRWSIGPVSAGEGLMWDDGSREAFYLAVPWHTQTDCGVTPLRYVTSRYALWQQTMHVTHHYTQTSPYGDYDTCDADSPATLTMPNGETYYLDFLGQGTGTLNHMEDQHGNGIQVFRDASNRTVRVVQSVGSATREVYLEYVPNTDRIASITFELQTWRYEYDGNGRLISATPPAGPAWQYSYPVVSGHPGIVVTTPTGGWVRYVPGLSRSCSGSPYPEACLSRDTGTGVVPDFISNAWAFSERQQWDPAPATSFSRITTVDGPLPAPPGTAYHAVYRHDYDSTNDIGLLKSSDIGNGAEITTVTWRRGSIPIQVAPVTVHVQRGTLSYDRTYNYEWEPGREVAPWITLPHWGQPTSIVETGDLPYSRTTTITYDQLTEPLSDKPHTIAVSGNGETYTSEFSHFPTNGWLSTKTVNGLTTLYYPDPYGNVWQEIDANGHATKYTYNWGVVASVETPEFTVTYDIARDSTVKSVERRGKRTYYYYDGGRLNRIHPPLGSDTTFDYAPPGWPEGRAVAAARGPSQVTTLFDEFGRTAGSVDAAGATTRTEFDEWGRPVYQSHPYIDAVDDVGIHTEYDIFGRITKVTNPDDTVKTWSYDGKNVTITDENRHSTLQVWDACGTPSSAWLASETAALNTEDESTTTYGYNLLGRLVRITSPEGFIRQWNYFTGTDRLQSVTIPESGTQQWTYDDAGLVKTTTDASGHQTTYDYDGNNRLRFVNSWDPNYTVEMRYDESDNRVWMRNAYSTTTFEYDDGNRLRRRTDVIDGRSFDTVYTPDDNDRLLDVQYPSGNHVSYYYDDVNDHGRLSRVYDDLRGVVFAQSFVYHPSGAITSYVGGDGITNTVGFDPNTYRPTHVTSTGGALDIGYEYDNVGNVKKVADTRLGNATFDYDALDRLKTANLPWAKVEYGYKRDGNRWWVRRNDVDTTNYNYDSITNRLSGTSGSRVETVDHYATNGLVRADQLVSNYTYTPNDLVETAANRAGGSYTYRYNADDERVLKVKSGGGTTYVVNGLSEFSTEGGAITWTVDYLYIGSRLLGAVRPAPGAMYTLNVSKSGDGAGRVSGLPAGLDCGPECAARYVSGTTVALTATPEAASYFTGWGGGCGGTATTINVTIDAAKDCTATFVSNKLTVTLSGGGTGIVTATGLSCQGSQCTGVYPLQTAVTLVATPGTGSAFSGWSGDADCGALLIMTAARSCTATFTPLPGYTLTIQKTGSGSAGSTVTSTPSGITCGATCAASYTAGTSVQLTAVAAWGFQFVRWDGTGCTTGTVTMTGALTCTAVFQALPCDPDGSLHRNCQTLGGTWNSATCSCSHFNQDPLLLTLDGGALALTDLAHGVPFDADGDGLAEQVAWTTAGAQVGFLVLDLNGNGVIDTGAELFAGPPSGPIRGRVPADLENSFTLLAAYDDPARGGNGDGVISAADAVFGQLRLWVDANHDGVSQPEELVSLAEAGIVTIELTYQPTGRRDGLGNFYRYRGFVHLTSGRSVPIWDVFLATGDAVTPQVAALEQRGLRAAVGHRLVQVGAWVRRALTPGGVSALTGTRAVRLPVSSGRTTAWWPADSRPRAEAVPPSPGDDEGGDNRALPEPQPPPPSPTQVVEYYHLDLLGSVRAVTDEQGNVIARHDFEPFGEELAVQNPPKDRKLFTGQERDFETGLDYFNARQYRPDLGQFTAPDPLSAAAVPVGSYALGSYTYVSNNPLTSIDPSGMFGITFGGATWGPGGASFWGYVGGGSWSDTPGWLQGGSPLGSVGGLSFSFSIGGSPSGSAAATAGRLLAQRTDWQKLTGPGESWTGTALYVAKDLILDWRLGFGGDDPRPSCVGNYVKDTLRNLAPWEPSLVDATRSAREAGQFYSLASAIKYAQSRGLTYPQRSTVFQAKWGRAGKIGKFGAVATLFMAEAFAFNDEVRALRTGQCY